MIELPSDANGCVIPLDTKVLYDECGTKVSVKEFLSRTSVENRRTEWTIKAAYEGNFYYNSFKPKSMHLTRPDSWERLEEDLNRCIEADDSCRYYSASGICAKCTRPDSDGGGCTTVVFSDIKKRIRKLRGED